MEFKTEQEKFWNGKFGDDYVDRNRNPEILASNIAVWSSILRKMNGVESVIEFGANIGLVLKAIRTLRPNIACAAIEINHKAATILREDPILAGIEVIEGSILEYEPGKQYDLAYTSGVLIHINPECLGTVYDKLYASSKKYILMREYYNPVPMAVSYRGNEERLFKRDFAGEFMDRFPDVSLVDYGFVYHRDNVFPEDDLTWFLMEKR